MLERFRRQLLVVGVVLLSGAGLGCYYYPSRNAVPTYQELYLHKTLWGEGRDSPFKRHQRKWKAGGISYRVVTKYQLLGDFDVGVKRVTEMTQDGERTREVDYFLLTPLQQEHAAMAHALVRESGADYFGRERVVYEALGEGLLQAESNIAQQLHATPHWYALFHAPEARGACRLVGSAVLSGKGNTQVGGYWVGAGEVTGLKGVGTVALRSVVALHLLLYPTVDRFVLNIHQYNVATQRVAEKAGFEYLGQDTRYVLLQRGIANESNRQKDFQTYVLYCERGAKHYLK